MSVLPMMQVVLLESDVQFVGHQLAETGSGALAGVRLANIKRGGVVLVNHDPRVDLAEIGIGIRARPLRRRAALRVRLR